MINEPVKIDIGCAETRSAVEALLRGEGLTLDANLEYTCGIYDSEGKLAATGSAFGKTLRCIAVDRAYRGEHCLNAIVNHLTEYQVSRGIAHIFIFTKCESSRFFENLGYYRIASLDGKLVFLENRPKGFETYLLSFSRPADSVKRAAAVMNANPFTLGHEHLLRRIAEENDEVLLFILSGDDGPIPFSARWKMAVDAAAYFKNVRCIPGGDYMINRSTFPAYFLRDSETVIKCQTQLDAVLFARIAVAAGICRRYVGSEPTSIVTGLYNKTLLSVLPESGIETVVVPRLEINGQTVSASTVRRHIREGDMDAAFRMLPDTSRQFFLSSAGAAVVDAIRTADTVIHY